VDETFLNPEGGPSEVSGPGKYHFEHFFKNVCKVADSGLALNRGYQPSAYFTAYTKSGLQAADIFEGGKMIVTCCALQLNMLLKISSGGGEQLSGSPKLGSYKHF